MWPVRTLPPIRRASSACEPQMEMADSSGVMAHHCKIACNSTANYLARQAGKISCMQLGEIVSKLREANGWGTPALARRIKKFGFPKIEAASIQQLEGKPDTRPRYLTGLASAFEKTVEDLYAWRPGMPILGPNKAAMTQIVPDTSLSLGLQTSRNTHEIDQLRIALVITVDYIIGTRRGAAAVLLDRLKFAIPQDYAEHGFQARLLSILQSAAEKEAAAPAATPRHEVPAASRRKR